nr:alpha/beta fold hydrolase [Streptomyces sp. NRRL S-1868]
MAVRTAATPCTAGVLALTLAVAVPSAAAALPAPPPGAPGVPGGGAPADEADRSPGVLAAAHEAAAEGIDWRRCPAAERLPSPVECGTVRVPVDYARPRGERIRLTVSRMPATGPARARQGALVYNPGGPGGNGMSFPLYGKQVGGVYKRLNAAYDLIGYAPRGVGRSAPLSCQDPKEFWRGPNPAPVHPSEAFKQRKRERARSYAEGCARAQGDRLRHYTTPNNARDLDVLRAALGERRLNFLGVSYGTYIGSVYATLFPGHVRRLVLDSVVDPSPHNIWYRANLDQNLGFERRWNDWKKWTAKHDDVYGLGRTARQVQSRFDAARASVARSPAGGTVGPKELLNAFLDTGYSDTAWPRHAEALARFGKGDERPLVKLAAPDPSKAVSEENGNAVYNAVECGDAPWPRDWPTWDRDNTASAAVAPFETWDNAWMNLPCAYWKTPSSRPLDVRTTPGQLPPVLLVAATRDGATPYSGALETRRRLAGSSLVTERGAGQHGVTGGNRCVDAHVERYLLTGKVPGDRADCAPRPAPRPDGARARTVPTSNSRAAR